jgi:hypothetical protein
MKEPYGDIPRKCLSIHLFPAIRLQPSSDSLSVALPLKSMNIYLVRPLGGDWP